MNPHEIVVGVVVIERAGLRLATDATSRGARSRESKCDCSDNLFELDAVKSCDT